MWKEDACGLTDIRIIRKVIRAASKILAEHAPLPDNVLSRVIPSTVLLSATHYRVIIVHGADAVAQVQSKAPAVVVLAVPHFSRGWSHESARDLGRKVKQMIDG